MLSCLGGGAEAEYALFEAAEIELRASEPGRVREHGYLTTAGQALEHLEAIGVTTELARQCANAMQPSLAEHYARGAAVRRIAKYLRAVDLLRSDVYDAVEGSYRGHFLSLVELCQDAGMKGAQFMLQVCHLALLLEETPKDTSVFLSTDILMKGARPGARSFHRVLMPSGDAVLDALSELARRGPQTPPRDELARPQVLEWIRGRAEAAPNDATRLIFEGLEREVSARERPVKGPLSDPALWELELELDAGALEGKHESLDALERSRGREPGTTYLRARLALLAGIEPARFVAERVSALALSMTNFHELELLAAEAWIAADEPRRALPYARDLVEAPNIDEGLRMRASRVMARITPAGPEKHKTYADGMKAPLPSRPPPGSPSVAPELAPAAIVSASAFPPPRRITKPGLAATRGPEVETSPPPPAPDVPAPSVHPEPLPPPPSVRPALPKPLPPPNSARPAPSAPPASASAAPPMRTSTLPGTPRPPSPSEVPPLEVEPRGEDASAGFTMELPPLDAAPETQPAPRASDAPAAGEHRRSDAPAAPTKPTPAPMRRRFSGAFLETRTPGALFADPRAEPDADPPPRVESIAPTRSAPPGARSRPPPARSETPPARTKPAPTRSDAPPPRSSPPARSEAPGAPLERRGSGEHTLAVPSTRMASAIAATRGTPMRPPPRSSEPDLEVPLDAPKIAPSSQTFLQGASQPLYQSERPPPLLPKASLFPKVAGDEPVEHLSLPPGVGGTPPRPDDPLPTSILEARVQFTQLARELGLDYRLKRVVELRTDLKGIEIVQAALLEMFPDNEVRTSDEAHELKKHGAFLSELLARRLDAEWVDISANDPGYWAMIVPPDTRVWPFGRIARFISLGHKERDLVSYFLELQARARGR